MAMKIRLARGGSKKRPFYRIVAADSRMPRDGRFIEKLGTYNPLLPKDSEERVKMNMERIQYWLDQGAQPTDRIARMLEAAGARDKAERNNPNKGTPGKKAQSAPKRKPPRPLKQPKPLLLRQKKLQQKNKQAHACGITPLQTIFARSSTCCCGSGGMCAGSAPMRLTRQCWRAASTHFDWPLQWGSANPGA